MFRACVLVALLALTPVASAGPLAELPVAGHGEGCYEHAGHWYNERVENGTTQAWWWSYESSGCSEWYVLSSTVTLNGRELAGVHAMGYGSSGNGSSYSGSWWSDGDDYRYWSSSSAAQGTANGTTVGAWASSAHAVVWSGCTDHGSYHFWSDGTIRNDGSQYADGFSHHSTKGCHEGASVYLDQTGEVARASTFSGCEQDVWSSDRRSHRNDGSSESSVQSGGGRMFCGDRYALGAEGAQVQVSKGTRCDQGHAITHSEGSWRSVDEYGCTRGVEVEGPQGAYVLVGDEGRWRATCEPDCSVGTSTFEGVRVGALGLSQDVPVAGLSQLLP